MKIRRLGPICIQFFSLAFVGCGESPGEPGVVADEQQNEQNDDSVDPAAPQDPEVTAKPPTLQLDEGGYFKSASWAGYAWASANEATISPEDFTENEEGAALCVNGSVSATEDWSGVAMLGINLNQMPGEDTPLGTVIPTEVGITVKVENPGGSSLRVQIQGPEGATDEDDRWCATIAGSGGSIPYERFNTKCWDDSGESYQRQPLVSAAVLVPGANDVETTFDFCLTDLFDGLQDEAGGSPPDGGENSGDGVVGHYGELYCGAGAKLHGSKTQSIAQVRGMSFFWSNWSAGLWRTDMVDRMVEEMKSELIRLPMGVDDFGTPYNSANEQLVKKLIEHAVKRGIYVIVDWHTHGANLNIEAAKDYFERMAHDYGHLDNVIFEIFNEPVSQSWNEVKSYAEQVIPVIRAHSDNLILVGTPNWSQDVDIAAGNPLESDNIAYVLHFYALSHQDWLRSKGNTALNSGKCLFVSEWGATHADGGQAANGNEGIDYESTKAWLAWLDQNNISWANWSIMNKAESSSIFNPGSEELSEGGKYLKEILNGYVESNPWR